MCINMDAFSYVYSQINEKSRLFSVMAGVPSSNSGDDGMVSVSERGFFGVFLDFVPFLNFILPIVMSGPPSPCHFILISLRIKKSRLVDEQIFKSCVVIGD